MSIEHVAIGFDFGFVRIGVAIGQQLTATARPLAILKMRHGSPDWDAITTLVDQWQPDLFVLGLPYHADGTPTKVTKAALRFSRGLQARYHLPVKTMDERLSSQEAKAYLRKTQSHGKRRGRLALDATAAVIILESWFYQQKMTALR